MSKLGIINNLEMCSAFKIVPTSIFTPFTNIKLYTHHVCLNLNVLFFPLGNWEIKYTVTEEPINLGLFEMINNQMVVRRHLRAGEYSVIIRAEILRKQDKLGRKQVVASIQHQMNVIVMAEGRDKVANFRSLIVFKF